MPNEKTQFVPLICPKMTLPLLDSVPRWQIFFKLYQIATARESRPTNTSSFGVMFSCNAARKIMHFFKYIYIWNYQNYREKKSIQFLSYASKKAQHSEEPSVGDDIPQGGWLFWTSIVNKVAMYMVNSWVLLIGQTGMKNVSEVNVTGFMDLHCHYMAIATDALLWNKYIEVI